MIRYYEPYNGQRFLLNKKTKEIHDLTNESSMCHIDDIDEKDISMVEDEGEVSYLCSNEGYEGCCWCNQPYNSEGLFY